MKMHNTPYLFDLIHFSSITHSSRRSFPTLIQDQTILQNDKYIIQLRIATILSQYGTEGNSPFPLQNPSTRATPLPHPPTQVDWILDAASLKYAVFSKPWVRARWRRSLSGIKANDKNNLRYRREGGDELLPQELPDSSQELQEGPSPQPVEESRSPTQSITFFSNWEEVGGSSSKPINHQD